MSRRALLMPGKPCDFVAAEDEWGLFPRVWRGGLPEELAHLRLGDGQVTGLAFHAIAWPEDLRESPFWASEIGVITLGLRQQTLKKLIAKRFAGRVKEFGKSLPKLPRHWPKEVRELTAALVAAETNLWLSVWRVGSEIYNDGATHPALTLYYLLQEPGGLLMPHFSHVSTNRDAAISRIQRENRQLSSTTPPQNPFCPDSQPVSYWFTNKGLDLACSELGRKDWYELVRARMALVTLLKQQGAKAIGWDGQGKKAGRSKKVQSATPESLAQ